MIISNTPKSILKFIQQELISNYPDYEAQSIGYLILEHFFGITRKDLLMNTSIPITQEVVLKQLMPILVRLKRNEPIQYILGKTFFYGYEMVVNPSVLIPRPETEELVHLIVNDLKNIEGLKILDVCTGSGCIAIALAKSLKGATISAVDISEEALKTAQVNIRKNEVIIELLKGDILKEEFKPDGTYDVIVSNPPYIETTEKELMQDNVLNYEPHLALFVEDRDPLIFYKKIAELALRCLASESYLFFEINERFGKEVQELLQNSGFSAVEIVKDINGKDRMIRGRKSDNKI